ncbi:hypothetical protein LSAT2_001487, partial [Lamellibrachia satsuma]
MDGMLTGMFPAVTLTRIIHLPDYPNRSDTSHLPDYPNRSDISQRPGVKPTKTTASLKSCLCHASILKSPSNSKYSTLSCLIPRLRLRVSVVRFHPFVAVRVASDTGIEAKVLLEPLSNDTKNSRRSHLRRNKSFLTL